MSLIAAGYIGVNALFALAYLAGGDSIENAEPGSFRDAFFFSVQTLASIGYGAMHPRTTYAGVLVTLEAPLGVVGVAIATGLAFARFACPTARVLFSRVAVVVCLTTEFPRSCSALRTNAAIKLLKRRCGCISCVMKSV